MSSFNANVIVSEQMERLISTAAQELTMRAINACADHYKFDAEEAIRFLGLESVKVSRKQGEKPAKEAKIEAVKASFPLPYSGECNDALCHGLRQNNSLFTQCQVQRKGENQFCKSCQSSADNNSGIPEYGTIEQRQAVGILEYVDPKGRKPIAYTKIMKKFKVNQEQVLEEAGKMSINIDMIHFEEPEQDGKRGRPKAEKAPKEPKGAKGRPKKTKKVLEIEGDEEDLFASLVASANSDDYESEEEELVAKPVKKAGKSDDEREAERIAKEEQRLAEKAAKEEQRLAEKEAKAAKLAAEKEAKLAAEKEAKALKKQQEEEAKAAKEAQRLKEKEEKEAKEAQRLKEKEEKEATKATKTKKAPAAKVEAEVEADEEPDVVRKFEEDGKKYLKSKKTGIIYDYKEWTVNGEQVVVGKWNESKNKIDFAKAGEESDEESEEEYEDEEA